MMTRPVFTSLLPLLLIAGLVLAWSPLPAMGQDRDDGEQAEEAEGPGADVRGGGELRGTRVRRTMRIPVREVNLCDLLRRAAARPGRKFKQKLGGKTVKFKGHKPWAADLICRWISRATGATPAFTHSRRGYIERQGFLSEALTAFQDHAGVATAAIDRERLRVGEKIFEWRTLQHPGGKIERKKPKARKMWVIRSVDHQDRLLLGLNKKYFTTKGKKPIGWIRDAESFLIRAFALAATGQQILQRGDLWPTYEMGKPVEAAVKAFIARKATLKNTKSKPSLKEYGGAKGDKSQRRVLTRKELEKLRADERHVELGIARHQIPVPGADGLNFFEYTAMGSSRRKAWFLQTLATGTGGYEAGGITLPIWRFEPRDPRSLPLPDTLFDEATRARVETRFEVVAVCLVRLHYHEVAPGGGATTAQVLAHERRHFDGIRGAWQTRTARLAGDLNAFAATLNRGLGIAGDEAFRYRRATTAEVWLPDKRVPNASAIPIGPLVPGSHQIQFHSFPEVQILRFRLTREIGAEQTGAPLIEMIESGKDFDPRFEDARKVWAKWWKDNGHNYKTGFVRDMLIAALNLDAREGMLLESGRQVGRRSLARVAQELARRTDPDNPKTAKNNPLKELEKLLGKHGIR